MRWVVKLEEVIDGKVVSRSKVACNSSKSIRCEN